VRIRNFTQVASAKLIAFSGAMAPVKGVDFLNEALPDLRSATAPFRLPRTCNLAFNIALLIAGVMGSLWIIAGLILSTGFSCAAHRHNLWRAEAASNETAIRKQSSRTQKPTNSSSDPVAFLGTILTSICSPKQGTRTWKGRFPEQRHPEPEPLASSQPFSTGDDITSGCWVFVGVLLRALPE
jgi:hypothetical protein